MKVIIHDLPDEEFKRLGLFSEEYKIISARDKAAYCQGCFGCWLKTPGKCVFKDSLQYIGTIMASSEKIIVISRCCYGGYSVGIKRALDRSIAASLPFFTYRAWRIHHVSRYQNKPSLWILSIRNKKKIILFSIGYSVAVVLDKAHNLVRKDFPARFAEMDMNIKGRTADSLYKVGLGVLYCPLGYSSLGGGFYYFLAGKLFPVCDFSPARLYLVPVLEKRNKAVDSQALRLVVAKSA